MVSAAFQIMGMALSVMGWIGAIITCALPMWKVTAFIGTNIVTAQITWEGLWMSCVVQSTGQMQCKVYDSMLALPQDIQTARALMVICVLLALFALMVGIVGAKCTNCVEEENVKARIIIAAGSIFVVAGILCLIPVCWSANTIIREFYSPLIVEAQKRELGSSLYLGWAAAALMILGGALLCCNCPKKESNNYSARYTAAVSQPRSDYPTAAVSQPRSDYPSKNYV